MRALDHLASLLTVGSGWRPPEAIGAFLDSDASSLTFDPMSARDRGWTITPTLLWFGAFMIIGLFVIDGDVQALADRVTARDARPAPPAAGPSFAPRVTVAAADDSEDDNDDSDASATSGGGGGGGATPAGSNRGSAGAAAVQGPLEDTCLDGSGSGSGSGSAAGACKRWAMDGFYRAVADEKAGKLGRPVRVSWYGDSVVATDEIPGRLRKKLQAALGDGGPGFVFIEPPHRFCGHEAITRGGAGTWATHAISTQLAADGWYGVGGSSAESDDGRSTIKLVSGKATHVELYYLAQPHGGTATVTADGSAALAVDTKADAKAAGYAPATIADGAAKFDVTANGRVRLFGLDLENGSGAVVDNFGIVSVHVKSFAVHDQDAWTGELAHRGADLIMIMIGANEAEWLGPNDQDTRDYAAHYAKVLAPIRKARPDATCLVVSPTDQAEAKDGAYPSRPVMPVLVEAQRTAAHANGCAFFSTYRWMGGPGSASKWYAHRLVGNDFQHLTQAGANKLGDAVFDALMAGAGRYTSAGAK
jgi:lysophospholipase L1-like esterase